MTTNLGNLPGIQTAAMLGSLNVSVWEGRKKDKDIEQDVADRAGARSKRATSVHKHLFVDCPPLEAIKSLRGEARLWFNKYTLPWDDNGRRLIPTAIYFEIQQEMANYESRFAKLVQTFVQVYSTEISKQAFERGAMFNRDEYPKVEDIADKFCFTINLTPVPMSGDFRVDIGNDALKELNERCEADTQMRVKSAMSGAWERVKEQVEWVLDRMTAAMEYDPNAVEEIKEYDDAGNVTKLEIKKKRRPKMYESMLDQGLETCGLLRDLNVTNDPDLEEARRMLEKALVHVDMKSLKESPELQATTKNAMQAIKDKFAF